MRSGSRDSGSRDDSGGRCSGGRLSSGGHESLGLEAILDAIRSGTLSKIHRVRATPGLGLGIMAAVVALIARVSSAIVAAGLLRCRVETVGRVILRRARLVTSTTSISASVTATTADRLIRLVSGSRTASKAEAFNRSLDQLVRHELGGGVAGTSQNSNRGNGSEKHLVE